MGLLLCIGLQGSNCWRACMASISLAEQSCWQPSFLEPESCYVALAALEFVVSLLRAMSPNLPEKPEIWPSLRDYGWPCLEIETPNPELSGLPSECPEG